ncbi:MAG: hypothetical protein WHS64_01340 [Fervidobacterium sp.]|jgi:hypothetical protein|uniref:Uncharacterized protein n=1 Tax=Fervidobacterium gondwanense DSM 13020 TaxID=1121883 RepID=A0A1M7RZ63_FERGO|nr:hypothetical protein [Fervidobacterium gondwanense]UXF00146.1 hypothetical protein IB67_00670 [Fervidobacterium riparium]SHN51573.1 hypothetical protein SAMN02745226_00361 [Fervidobacterium gondwanense DSM 13020]
MKLEFYALAIFIISLFALVTLTLHKRPLTEEEVLPSPSVFVKNPYKRLLEKKVNEMNQQLFFLEYNISIKIPESSKQLEKILDGIKDPRALKQITKRVWHYWWGYGIENIKYKVKHIELVWYPAISISTSSNLTFGDALYMALNGENSSFNLNKSDIELVNMISEKYKVEIIIDGK